MAADSNVYDLVKNRDARVMDQVDSMVKTPTPPAPAVAPAADTKVMPMRGTTNPDSRLPDTEGVFHKIVRRFKGDPVGTP